MHSDPERRHFWDQIESQMPRDRDSGVEYSSTIEPNTQSQHRDHLRAAGFNLLNNQNQMGAPR